MNIWSLSPTPAEAVETAAAIITSSLQETIAARGQASLAVSGGSSPIPLFERLSNARLAWDNVILTLADERWVDAEHPDSNERLVRSHLLKNNAVQARFFSLKTPEKTPTEALSSVEQRLAIFPSCLDVVVLGMGMDGHTLSWFPDAPQLHSLLDPNNPHRCGDALSASAPHPRLSLTFSWIRHARQVILFLPNQQKTRHFQTLLTETSPLPVSYLARALQARMTVVGVD